MKRIAYFLMAVLTVASVVSCADQATTDNGTVTKSDDAVAAETDAVTEEPSLLDSLGEKDLGGLTYTIFDCNQHPELQINIPGEEMTGDVVNDALLARDLYLEETYNCEIEYLQEDNVGMLKTMVSAGDDEWQMIIHPMAGLTSQATGGYLANMCDMPYMEMNQSWWNPLLYENLRLHDAMYITSSDIAPGIYQMPTCLFLNLKLYTDYDYDFDIFQSVIDGKWTMDQLRSMIKDMDVDMNADNKWTVYDDFFGFAMHNSTEAVLTTMIGCGINMSRIVDDGTNIVCDLSSDSHAIEVVESIVDMYQNITWTGDINDYSNIMFQGDRALFFMHKLESAAVHLRDMDSDYLILPSPKWDESQESYYSFLSPHGSCFVALPQTVAGNENYGFLTEALARYSNQYVRPIAYDLVYKEKDSRDPRSVDVLNILLDCTYIDFQSLFNFGTVNDSLQTVFFNDKPLVSTLEKRQASVDKAIVKLVENWMPVE